MDSVDLESSSMLDFGDVLNTRIDANIPDLYWGKDHSLGAGINALTGAITATALEPFVPRRGEAVKERHAIRVLCTHEALKKELGLSADNYLNVAPLDCRVGVLSEVKSLAIMSDTSLSVLVLFKSETQDGEPETPYELTEEARSVLAHDGPVVFRERYGDYFIYGLKYGCVFTAVVTCTFNSTEERRRASAMFSARATASVFNAEAAAEVDRAMMSVGADMSIRIESHGLALDAYNDDPCQHGRKLHAFAEILPLLDWFKRHRASTGGIPLYAMLRPYSAVRGLGNAVLQKLPVSPDVFHTVRQVRDSIFVCQMLAASLPDYAVSEPPPLFSLRSRVLKLSTLARSLQEEIATCESTRLKLRDTAQQLQKDLVHVHEVHGLFQQVVQACMKQPGQDRQDVRASWGFGLNPEHSVAGCPIEVGQSVEIRVPAWDFRHISAGKLVRRPGEHIVGWRVDAHNPRRSSWRQETSSVILSRELEITCQRERRSLTWFRSCRWTFTTYVVRNNEFFNLFYRHEYEDKANETKLTTRPLGIKKKAL